VDTDNEGTSRGKHGHPKLKEAFRAPAVDVTAPERIGRGREDTDLLPALGRACPLVSRADV
jgi:hypothetical protein